jgi:hypothetical protein
MKKTQKQAILSLDLGSNLGWALKVGDNINSGVLNLKTKGKFSVDGYARLCSFLTTHLLQITDDGIGQSNFTLLVEIPHCGKFMAANRILFGLLGVIDMWKTNYSIKSVEYRPKAIKKFWTGNGNADKKKMVEAAKERGMTLVTNHNEIDALAMLYFHISKEAK